MENPRTEYLRRLGALRTERSSFLPHWQELNDYILPRSGRFLVSDRNRGDKRNQKINDSTATYASNILASGMMGGLTSPSRPWFALRTPDPALNEFKPVRIWLDQVKTRMFEVFLASNLYTQLPNTYEDLGVFGTNAFAVLEDPQDVIRCFNYPIGSYCLGTSYRGNVNTCYREFSMTAAQMVEQFGKENCSNAVVRALTENPDAWFEVVHAVQPNTEFEHGALEHKGMAFESCYFEKGGDSTKMLRESGYHDFPVMASRWKVTGEDIYGNSPGMVVLPAVKQLQLMTKKKMQAIEKMVNPPMNAPSSLKNGAISTLPGGINFVDVSTGQQGFTPAYQINPQIDHLRSDIQDIRQEIRQIFHVDMFLMMSDDNRSGITATEIAARKEEKLVMLGPVLERLNDELFDPLIDRVYGIMDRAGLIPPPPPELQGQDLSIEYISVIAQAMKLVGMGSIERYASFTGSLAAVFPEVVDKFNADAAMDAMGDALAVPPLMTRDAGEVGMIRQGRAQAQQQQQMLDQAQQGAQTAQTLADTRIDEPSALNSLIQQMRGVA